MVVAKVKRLIELNDQGIFVTSDANINGKRLVEYVKKHRKATKSIAKAVTKDKEQLCLKD